MSPHASFRPYSPADAPACLALFDANSPGFFAPNERVEYATFLDACPSGYELCVEGGEVVGAYGLIGIADRRSLNWILIHPAAQGGGIGSAMMSRALGRARAEGVRRITIAASHRSAPFFARFGAIETVRTEHGWGPDMHRIDMALVL